MAENFTDDDFIGRVEERVDEVEDLAGAHEIKIQEMDRDTAILKSSNDKQVRRVL